MYINAVYLLLRDAKLLMRDSIYKLYINTVYLLLKDSMLAILRCLLPSALIIKSFLMEFKIISYTFPLPLEVLYS